MHFGDNLECCCTAQLISCQSEIVRPQWKHEMKSLFPVREKQFFLFYISGFLRNSSFILKVVTCVKEASFTQAFDRMFTGGWQRVKRHYPGNISPKLRVQRSIPLCRVVLTLSKFKNPGVCCCQEKTLKISGGRGKSVHITKQDIQTILLTAFWLRIGS